MTNCSFKYPKLNDDKWLYQKYIVEQCSTVDIAKLAGAKTANSARQALIRCNISIRSIGDGLRCNREDYFVVNREVIEGCLLGDGYLVKWNKNSEKSYPYFAKRNKYYDHIRYDAQMLFTKSWEQRVKENNEISLGKKQVVFSLRSLSNNMLAPFYKRWYPKWNDYKKVIPEDVEVTPTLLLHWFLDDGSSYQRRKKSKIRQVLITFCTECFSKDNQMMIIEKIKKRYSLNFALKKVNYGTRYQMVLPQSQASLFYDTIGNCPVPSMEYKWK